MATRIPSPSLENFFCAVHQAPLQTGFAHVYGRISLIMLRAQNFDRNFHDVREFSWVADYSEGARVSGQPQRPH